MTSARSFLLALCCLLPACSKENDVDITTHDECEDKCPAGTVCEAPYCRDTTRAPCGWFLASAPQGGEMCEVPAASYVVGCDASEAACPPESQQRLSVQWSSPFLLDAYEVTNEQFASFLATYPTIPEPRCSEGSGPWAPGSRVGPSGFEQHPVVCVTPSQAEAFCQSVGKKLPSEAQWESAARGTGGERYPWGNAFDPNAAQCKHDWNAFDPNVQCANKYEAGTCPQANPTITCMETAPTRLRPAGRASTGPYDLAGNVSEWVSDGWTASHAPCSGPCVDPAAAPVSGSRVYKGGSWSDDANGLSSWGRQMGSDTTALPTVGFRCAGVSGKSSGQQR